MNKVLILIPARYESSRFNGKPLAKINGKEMIIRVIERSTYKYDVIAVVNDNRIANIIEKNGYKYILIKENCNTGTDRISLSLERLKLNDNDIIINVQGDEPMISSWMIDRVVEAKKNHPNHVINAFSKINTLEELKLKSTIKVIVNKSDELIYASRSDIPSEKNRSNLNIANKQVCIYAFSKYQLQRFFLTERGPIEKSEDIEILRFIENSLFPVKMVNLGNIKLHAVDYPSDINKVENCLGIDE
tara:strand:- start:432 stop:1169 length:738 start_codon:yes stop_codon:yes gene_type:complete